MELSTQAQYSILVAGVIGSAVVPTMIANAFYLPKHLLPKSDDGASEAETATATDSKQARATE